MNADVAKVIADVVFIAAAARATFEKKYATALVAAGLFAATIAGLFK